MKNPIVGWYDPNFGIRFNDYLNVIEEVIPPGKMLFGAESSLSLLNESNVKRLRKNGFKYIAPGIESWYDMGNKSRTGKSFGLEKVKRVADQMNMISEHIPYLQGNLIIGLDTDEGAEPFELSKQFLDLTPGILPSISMSTAFGRSAPAYLEYQRDNRVLPLPFHHLQGTTMNIRPKNYEWPELFDLSIDLLEHTFSYPMSFRRIRNAQDWRVKVIYFFRGLVFRNAGKLARYKEIRRLLDEDRQFRNFYEQETNEIPQYFVDGIKKDMGSLWEWLPHGALYHDQNAYYKGEVLKASAKKNEPKSRQFRVNADLNLAT